MNDENTNGSGRHNRIESNIEALTEQNKILGERIAALLGAQAETQTKLDQVICLVGSIADKTF